MSAAPDIRAVEAAPDGPPRFATREQWHAELQALAADRTQRAWRLADILVAIVEGWGRAGLAEAAEIIEASPAKCQNYLLVGQLFPPDSRRITLGFAIHMEVARLPGDARTRLLDAAEAGGWTRDQVRAAVREARGETETERLRSRIAELEQLLELERATADQAKRARAIVERSTRDSCRRIAESHRDLCQDIRAYVAAPAFTALHGNEKRAVVRGLRAQVVRCTQDAADLVDRELGDVLGGGG